MICGNHINWKQIQWMQDHKLPFTLSFYDCIDEVGNSMNREVQAPRTLTYNQLFFLQLCGNLTGIYEVDFFGKIPLIYKKTPRLMLWLTIPFAA
jgi:hypothetical protein